MSPLPRFFTRSLAISLFALVLLALPAFAAGGDTMGRVTRVKGQALAVFEGETRPLAAQGKVFTGDVIRTGQDARVEIMANDNTVLTLSGDTEFSVARYDLGRQQGAGAVLMKLTKGAFRVVTGELSSLRGGPFEVSTPLATIGIRGTDFWGGYITAEAISVMLIEGKGVYIKNDAGMSEIVRPGDGITVSRRDQPPPAPNLWSPELRARAYKMVSFD